MKKIISFLLSLLILSVFGAGIVSAQGNPPTSGGNPPTSGGNPPTSGGTSVLPFSLPNPFGETGNSLLGLLVAIIDKILLPIGGIIAVLAFIYSGFLFVSAQGNEAKLKTAKQALLYTAVGTAVLLGSWVIANVIANTIDQLRT